MSEALRVTVEDREAYAVIKTEGYINNAGGEEIARQAVALFDAGKRRLLFNLSGTKIVNSIGISILIEVLEKAIELDAKIAFSNLTTPIEKTFRIMGFPRYSTIHPTEEEAAIALLAPKAPSHEPRVDA